MHGEVGGDSVGTVLNGAVMSAVNWSEVVQKSLHKGANVEGMLGDMVEMGLTVAPFTASQADRAAMLWQQTQARGLSLGDRACLALGLELAAPVLTADRSWIGLDAGLDIRLIR
ncbi:PIN domain-containing protein [Methylogaea oryzae]|uniref:PIN domain-containing protein n=1 Tax=Methylogaea oryzae TaxID=1295382 RepID=UPI0020D07722|nr:type II toxin-antitoxin system VapC family toxin [Methylogaea oryzae]